MNAASTVSIRLFGGLTTLIILTLDGNSGIDLLDAIINTVQAYSVTLGG